MPINQMPARPGLNLRPYQETAVNEIVSGLAQATARLLFTMPPGAGKTETAIGVAQELLRSRPDTRFLILTHRNILINQTAARFRQWGIPTAAATSHQWKPGQPLPDATAVVMGPATATSRKALSLLDPDIGWVLIVDEAHHAAAASWRHVIEHFPGPVLGLTATPWRLDRSERLADLFTELITGPQPRELIRAGYLAEPIVMAARPEQRIKGGKKSRGDFTAAGIMAANDRVVLTERAIEWWQAVTKGALQTIIYAMSRSHALNLADALDTAGVTNAVVLSDTPEQDRERIGRQFSLREFQCLINVAIYTEGADFREADCIMLLRPTESLALYLQKACRGMRPNGNQPTLILDATNNTEKHGLPAQDRIWSLEARGSKGNGTRSVKTCPECQVVTDLNEVVCGGCGYAYGETCIQCGRWRPWSGWREESDVCDDCQHERGFQYDKQTGIVIDDGWARSENGNPCLRHHKGQATLVRYDTGNQGYVMYLARGRDIKREYLGDISESRAKDKAETVLNVRATMIGKRITSCRSIIDAAAAMTDQTRKDLLLHEASKRAHEIRKQMDTVPKGPSLRTLLRNYDDLVKAGKMARAELALL